MTGFFFLSKCTAISHSRKTFSFFLLISSRCVIEMSLGIEAKAKVIPLYYIIFFSIFLLLITKIDDDSSFAEKYIDININNDNDNLFDQINIFIKFQKFQKFFFTIRSQYQQLRQFHLSIIIIIWGRFEHRSARWLSYAWPIWSSECRNHHHHHHHHHNKMSSQEQRLIEWSSLNSHPLWTNWSTKAVPFDDSNNEKQNNLARSRSPSPAVVIPTNPRAEDKRICPLAPCILSVLSLWSLTSFVVLLRLPA